jgi:hypothetical protein
LITDHIAENIKFGQGVNRVLMSKYTQFSGLWGSLCHGTLTFGAKKNLFGDQRGET